MYKNRIIIFCILLLNIGFTFGQKKQPVYLSMMNDPVFNYYQVVDSAEAYFSTIDREVKGSGWKPFLRWCYENEKKYYPSGDRTTVDFELAYKEFARIKASTPKNLYVNGWKDNGPYEIDSITGHYAAGLGRIEDVWVDPANDNIIYLGSRSGGFAGTQDGGQHWISGTTDFLPASGVNTLAANPTNSDEILINCQNSSNNYSHGVYRSLDGGLNWMSTAFIPVNVGYGGLGSNFRVHEIKFHPTIPNLVFIATNKGLYRSTDNLVTWTQLLPLKDIPLIEFHPTDPNYVYTYDRYFNITENKVYISSDQGLTFYLSNTIIGNNNDQVKLTTTLACPNNLYFSSNNGIWKSIDRGSNFTFVSNPATTGNGGFAIHDLDSSIMLRGYVDMFASINNGALFEQKTFWSLGNTNGAGSGHHNSFFTSTNYIHADIQNIDFVGGSFYACTDGFLSKSNDNGITWEIISDSLSVRENYCIGTSQSNNDRSIFGSQDNGVTIRTEAGWNEFYGADGVDGCIHPLNADWMIGSYQQGKRLRTKNGGLTLQTFVPPGSNLGFFGAPLEIDPNNQMTYFDFRDSIYKSTDFGSTFNTLGVPSSFSGTIMTSAIANNNSDIMLITQYENIEKTTNGGISFQNINNNLPDKDISAVTINPKDDNHFVVTYSNYSNDLYKIGQSLDGGLTWTNITYNLGNMPIRSVVIDHSDSSYIYVGAEIGVYYKSKNATIWTLYNPNLPNVSVSDLEICWGSNTLKAATWGKGFWDYHLVGRADFPAILTTKINNPPTDATPKEGVDQFVTSIIHYDQSLSSVFVEWSTGTPIFNNSIPMANISDSTWKSINPLPMFASGTKMYFRVLAVGQNGDTTETYKFMYTVKPGIYCAASGNPGIDNPRIISTNINGSITNSGDTDYQLYSSIVHPFYVDSTYFLSMTIANPIVLDNDYSIWIDLNNDLDFTPDETVLSSINQSISTMSTNFTVPSTVAIEDTVRVRMRISFFGSTTTPCGTTKGEVEDYLIHLRKVPDLSYSGNNLICTNAYSSFTYSGTNVDSLQWTFSGPANFSGSGLTFNPNGFLTGSYSLTLIGYKYGIPFTKVYPNVLTIVDAPIVTAMSSSNELCLGESVILNGNGTTVYNWNNGVQNNVAFTPLTTQTYLLTGIDSNNCSNIDSIEVVVNAIPNISISIDATNVLSAAGASSYQWINCSTNTIIAGEINQTFTPVINGEYAVIGNNLFNCNDTSNCILVSTLGLEDNQAIDYSIFPNPAKDKVQINHSSQTPIEFNLFDTQGKLLIKSSIKSEGFIDVKQYESGLYFLQLNFGGNISVERIIKI